jgi:hypothetical protein
VLLDAACEVSLLTDVCLLNPVFTDTDVILLVDEGTLVILLVLLTPPGLVVEREVILPATLVK